MSQMRACLKSAASMSYRKASAESRGAPVWERLRRQCAGHAVKLLALPEKDQGRDALNLVAHRQMVLEQDREVFTEMHATRRFDLHHFRARFGID